MLRFLAHFYKLNYFMALRVV